MSKTAFLIGTVLLAIVAGATLLFGQTGITIDMLRLTGPGDIIMKVGQVLQPVSLDTANFVLDTGTTPPTLHTVAPPPAPSIAKVEQVVTTTSETTPAISVTGTPIQGSVVVYRNGIRLAPGIDFNYSPAQKEVIFIEAAPYNNVPRLNNIIIVEYWETSGG